MSLYSAKTAKAFYNIVKNSYAINHSDVHIGRISVNDSRLNILRDTFDIHDKLDFSFVKQYLFNCKFAYHASFKGLNFFIVQKSAIKVKDIVHLKRTIIRMYLMKGLFQMKQNYNFYIIMNPLKRKLPKKEIMDTKHVNGGFTYVNRNNIFVIRKEDYDKVLIHELLHHNNFIHHEEWKPENILRLKKHFNIRHDCELLPNEAVIEVLACFINTVFYAIEFGTDFEELLRKEQAYSLTIAKKTLHFQNGKPWYERTNAFCYIILKTIMYLHIDKFLKIYRYKNDTDMTEFLIRYSTSLYKDIHTFKPKNASLKQTIF